MSTTEDLVKRANERASSFQDEGMSPKPKRSLAIVMCMDARMDAYGIFGLEKSDAHVIRNAGGIVTDDIIRSLIISQRLLSTNEIILVQHTDCGMTRFTDEGIASEIEHEVGIRPTFAFGSFEDLDENLRTSVQRIKESPFLLNKDKISGYIYEVETGKLRPST